MNELSLFTGCGGGVWGSLLLGHRLVGYVESDDYCQRIIKQRIKDGLFHDAPIFSDVRTFRGFRYRNKLDLISAGVPCQWVSVAGKRYDPSTPLNLWPDTIRIIGEARPLFAFFENPPRLVTHSYFGDILTGLEKVGYELTGPPKIVSAYAVGAPHERKRAWFLAADTERFKLWQQSWRSSRESRKTTLLFRDAGKKRRTSWSDGLAEVADDLRSGYEWSTRCQLSASVVAQGGWWVAEPGVDRVVYGLANRCDRIKALGNGQVPLAAAVAFRLLVEDAAGVS